MVYALLLVGLAAGCGGAQTPSGPPIDRLAPDTLYPLAEGNGWSFMVDNGIEQVLLPQYVQRVDGPRREVASGQTVIVYEVRPEGIFQPSTGTYVLKRPIEEGATWDAPSDRTARVTSTTASVRTGRDVELTDCVVVEVTAENDPQISRTTYCPTVGPVLVETEMHMSLSGETVRVVGRLLEYQTGG